MYEILCEAAHGRHAGPQRPRHRRRAGVLRSPAGPGGG